MSARTSLRDYQRALAERLASAEANAAVSKLGVQVAGEGWLVDLAEAAEVLPLPPITPVPLTRSWFRGLTNIRGNLYGVVDLAAFLGGPPTAGGIDARLLIVAERFRLGAAFLVERSLGLKNPAHLVPESGETPAWSRARYADKEGRQWKELDVPQLIRHSDFLNVAA